jgi:hypothetical protein
MKKYTYIGAYEIFNACIHVNLSMSKGDSYGQYGRTPNGFITIILADSPEWSKMVKNAVHEITEMAFLMKDCRFMPSEHMVEGNDDATMFICRHYELSYITDAVGGMLEKLLPDLEKVWKKLHKKNR